MRRSHPSFIPIEDTLVPDSINFDRRGVKTDDVSSISFKSAEARYSQWLLSIAQCD